MVAIVTVERQRWIQPSGKWGWEREKIEGQCFQDNVRFCLTLRFGKDGCFFMNYPLFPSQAKDWIEIISSLSYNLLSYFVWLHVHTYVHMLTYTHTHTHRGKTQQTFTCRLACGFIFFFFLSLFIFLCAGSLLLCGLSPVVASGGYPLVVVHRLLIAVASLVAKCGLSGCRTWA